MLRVKSGELDKLGILYERYKKRIFGFFYHMNGNPSQSEDLLQNVFVRILSYKHSYSEQNKFESWIFQIARNVNHDAYTAHSKKAPSDTPIQIAENFSNADDIHAQIVLDENISTLQRALNHLSFEKREVIVLSKLKELRYKEIANIMGCSEGSARTKLHRALQELKEVFLELEKR